MTAFNYRQQELYAESVAVADIVKQFGTPCYIYSRAMIEKNWNAYHAAFGNYPHRICYAVKANSNLAILNILVRLGSSFDIVSIGELERVLAAGGSPQNIVFSGVGKSAEEIKRALEVGIHCFNIESSAELDRIIQIASLTHKIAPIAFRLNPNVDAKTHPYIATGLKENKFGISLTDAKQLYLDAAKNPQLKIRGITCHIGSQLTELQPICAALQQLLALFHELQTAGIIVEHLDIGGGLGVRYKDEQPPSQKNYVEELLKLIAPTNIELVIEPGRSIVANAGILVTRVEYLKQLPEKNFAIVDAGMNDYIRPSLYSAWQNIIPVKLHDALNPLFYDVVGPVCETGDFFCKNRKLDIRTDDLLALCDSGAYGFSMASNYNSRGRPPEVMLDNDRCYQIRRRETYAELFAGETILP